MTRCCASWKLLPSRRVMEVKKKPITPGIGRSVRGCPRARPGAQLTGGEDGLIKPDLVGDLADAALDLEPLEDNEPFCEEGPEEGAAVEGSAGSTEELRDMVGSAAGRGARARLLCQRGGWMGGGGLTSCFVPFFSKACWARMSPTPNMTAEDAHWVSMGLRTRDALWGMGD